MLTKGPLALYYGGEEIIPYVSPDASTAYNTPSIVMVLVSMAFQAFLVLLKKLKFRQEVRYDQQLKLALMSGVRNVYSQLVIFLGLLGIAVVGFMHHYALMDNAETLSSEQLSKKDHFSRMVGFVFVFSLMIFHPFVRNPKLRYSSNYLHLYLFI